MWASSAIAGREPELAELTGALERLDAGSGQVYFVVGEPGIGKSRLVEEIARLAAARGIRVVWGRCWEGGGAPALWPWIQVLRALAGSGESLGDLTRLLPESAGEAAPADRVEVFDALARFLAGSAAARPLVVALEDLHAADRPSLAALSLVVRHAQAAPLLLVGTHRDVGASPSPEALELLRRAQRAATILRIGRLSRDDVAELIGRDPEKASIVHRATEGNPLFVHELMRVLDSTGYSAGKVPIPEGIRAAIREHVRLAGGADEPLEVAAVLGRDFALAALAAVLGRDPAALAEALAPAVRAGLVVETSPRHFRFTHTLVRETLYEDQTAIHRADRHRQVADALARLHAADPAAPLDEIAHHYFEAGPASVAAAVDHARRAAERAIRMLAFEEAAAGLDRAVRALEVGAPGDARLRAELYLELGRARLLAGDIEAGQRVCLEAAGLARGLDSAELLARSALTCGLVYTYGVASHELGGLLEEAIAALGGAESPLLARVTARLAGALQPAPTPDRPIALARASIEIARRLGDDETLLYALHAGGSAMTNLADPAERVELDRELVRLARARGDVATVLRGHARLFLDLVDLGDVAAADAEVIAYETAAARLRQPRYHWPGAMMRAARALMDGRFADNARHAEEALALAQAASDDNAVLCVAANELLLRRARGAVDATAPPIMMPAFTSIPGAAALFAIPLVPEHAAEARAAFLAAPEESLSKWVVWTSIGVRLAETALVIGDPSIAAKVHGWLQPVAERNVTWGGVGMACEGPVARWLCRLAALLGRREEAERHFATALERGTRMGMRPFVAMLQAEWAEELARWGRSGEAAALVEEARAAAGSLGMTELLARLPAGGQAAGGPIRLVREGEVWLVEGEGESCRLKDSRGLSMLARLIESPGRTFHCLELGGGPAGDGPIDTGDAGPALDARARAEYRSRIGELQGDIAEAESWNDPARAGRARQELELLERELARAVGLGGRDRKQAAGAERARVNVQRRLKADIERVRELAPALARRLAETVRTGTFCLFDPDAPRRRR